jgi:hypothetical protein
MRLLCHALIAGDHLDMEAITATIIANNQGKPACLFSLNHLSVTNLIDCCVSPPATTIGNNQIATEALLGLIQEGTADDEWIVGLDSLSIGNSKDASMEDTVADSNAADGNAADGAAANDAMIDLQQMGQRLHQFNILETFFGEFAGMIDWGGDNYDGTSLFDESGFAEGSNTGSTNKLSMAAGQEAERSML